MFLLQMIIYIFFAFSAFSDWRLNLEHKIKQKDYPSWMIEQINEELSVFSEKGVSEKDLYEVMACYPHMGFLMCKIHNNQLTWNYYPYINSTELDSRAQMFLEGLTCLMNTIQLPNMSFLVHTGEAFCEKTNVPVLTWCKHKEWSCSSLSIPDYEALLGNKKFLAEVRIGKHLYPWKRKIKKAFWRGGTTSGWGFECNPRLQVINESLKFPDILDARFTGIYPGQEGFFQEDCFGSSLSVSKHLEYKYQILIDGHVSSFSRFYWQLFSGCVIFKHDSCWYQWFYRDLKPYVHYIPFRVDATDLAEQINWALAHDNEAKKIAQNAFDFAKQFLTYENVMLYFYLALTQYSKLMK